MRRKPRPRLVTVSLVTDDERKHSIHSPPPPNNKETLCKPANHETIFSMAKIHKTAHNTSAAMQTPPPPQKIPTKHLVYVLYVISGEASQCFESLCDMDNSKEEEGNETIVV